MLPGRLVILNLGEYKRTKDPRNPFKGPYVEFWNPFLYYAKINASLIKVSKVGGCYNETSCDGIIGKLVTGEGEFTLSSLSHLTVNQSFIETSKWPGMFFGPMMGEKTLGLLQLNYTSGYVNELQFGLAEVDLPVCLLGLLFHITLIILNILTHLTHCKRRRNKCQRSVTKLFDPFIMTRSRLVKVWYSVYIFLFFQFMVDLTNSDLLVWISPKYHSNLEQVLLESNADFLAFGSTSDQAEILFISAAEHPPSVHSKLKVRFKQKDFFMTLQDISRGSVFAGRETSCSYVKSSICTLTKYKIPFGPFFSRKKAKSIETKTSRRFKVKMRFVSNKTEKEKTISLDLKKINSDHLKFLPWKNIKNMFGFTSSVKNTPLHSRMHRVSQKFVESGIYTRDNELVALRHQYISFEKMYNCLRSNQEMGNINRSINGSSQSGLMILLIVWGISANTFLATLSFLGEYLTKKRQRTTVGPVN